MYRSFKELDAWKVSKEIVVRVYELTASFPSAEKFGLGSQMQRSARSIAANIAEGQARPGGRDFARFLDIAIGSSSELESDLAICECLSLIKPEEEKELVAQIVRARTLILRLKQRVLEMSRVTREEPAGYGCFEPTSDQAIPNEPKRFQTIPESPIPSNTESDQTIPNEPKRFQTIPEETSN